MTAYYLLIGILLFVGSLAMIVWPRQVWQFGRGWRFTNPGAIELSPAYVSWLRISGVVGTVAGIIFVAGAFM